jgi:hypothetical protein
MVQVCEFDNGKLGSLEQGPTGQDHYPTAIELAQLELETDNFRASFGTESDNHSKGFSSSVTRG